jgi:uncharacterized protein YndB with AHSA1/START domain
MNSSAWIKSGVVHATLVVERRFLAPVDIVFAAFSDGEQRARWHFPGEDWELVEFKQDFRVGGREHSRFGPKGHANLREEGIFLDIVENVRILSSGTMHQDDVRISLTLCTVEFAPDGDGTRLKLTDQSAFLDGRERPDERRDGWGKVLRRLESFLTSSRPKA